MTTPEQDKIECEEIYARCARILREIPQHGIHEAEKALLQIYAFYGDSELKERPN